MDASGQSKGSGWILAIATIVAIIGTLAINTLSNFYPPGGKNVGEIANTTLAGVLITPANYAFAIWGLIYLGLIAYGVYQLGVNQRKDPVIRPVNRLLIVACVAQIVWIFLFTLQYFFLSVLAMLGILLPLIGAYIVLRIVRIDRQRRWLATYPFSIYLAWISVATIINVASALYDAGWRGGLSGVMWTVIMLLVSAAIALLVILTQQDIPFTLVYVWAYGAIALRHADRPMIMLTAIASAVVLVVILTLVRLRQLPALKTG
ncbi:MAG: tryptophan-rich sensory protein [Cyanobacteria bacterium P01_D01_bin.6]